MTMHATMGTSFDAGGWDDIKRDIFKECARSCLDNVASIRFSGDTCEMTVDVEGETPEALGADIARHHGRDKETWWKAVAPARIGTICAGYPRHLNDKSIVVLPTPGGTVLIGPVADGLAGAGGLCRISLSGENDRIILSSNVLVEDVPEILAFLCGQKITGRYL